MDKYFRAGNPSTPAAQLQELASDASPDIRLRVAENIAAPPNVLASLAWDKRPEIRAAVGANPSAPGSIVDRIAHDGDNRVRLLLAGDRSLSPEMLRQLTEDADPEVRQQSYKTLAGINLENQLSHAGFAAVPGEFARLGELIEMAGILPKSDLDAALKHSMQSGIPLGRWLAEQGVLAVEAVVELLNMQMSLRKGEIGLQDAISKLKVHLAQAPLNKKAECPEPGSAVNWEIGMRAMIDTAPDAIIMFDRGGTVLEWNRRAEVMFGYPRRDCLGVKLDRLITAESDPSRLIFQTKVLHAQNPTQGAVELNARSRSGQTIPVEITFNLADNDVYVAFVRDISERKRAEKQAAAQYALTCKLAEANSLTEIGPELLRLAIQGTGWQGAELYLVDENSDVLKRAYQWPPDESNKPLRVFAKGEGLPGYVWLNKRTAWVDAAKMRAQMGSTTHIGAMLGLPIIFQSEFYGVLTLLTTAHLIVPERSTIQMHANFCSQLAQFIQRVRTEKARQDWLLLKQREDFMYTLAHDLKTPLISGDRVLEILIAGSLGPLSDQQEKILSMLKDSNRALLHMVQNLLAVYRYESGAERLHLEPADLPELIQQCIKQIEPLAGGRSIKCSPPVSLSPVVCDALEIRRVISNLLSNAVKFTGNDGAINLTVHDDANEGVIKIAVEDNGIGVPDRDQENVFHRFWQGNRHDRQIGSGLGLHLCWNIITAHGGTILCQSVEGRGSKFTVVLPRSLRPNTVNPVPDKPNPPAFRELVTANVG